MCLVFPLELFCVVTNASYLELCSFIQTQYDYLYWKIVRNEWQITSNNPNPLHDVGAYITSGAWNAEEKVIWFL